MLRLIRTESFKLSRKLKSWLGPQLILVLVLIAFPLSIDISQYDLDKFYFSIIVISLMMTAFISTEGMFEEDFEDGSLEQEFLLEQDFYKIVLSKMLIYVFFIGIPIALIGSLFLITNGADFYDLPKVFSILCLSNIWMKFLVFTFFLLFTIVNSVINNLE